MRMYKILRKEKLNDVVELMEIHAPNVSRKCEPGQFIILRVGEDEMCIRDSCCIISGYWCRVFGFFNDAREKGCCRSLL